MNREIRDGQWERAIMTVLRHKTNPIHVALIMEDIWSELNSLSDKKDGA